MTSASGYVRLSKVAGLTNLSLEGMVQEVRDTAAREGLDLLEVHVDDGISGAVRDRPEFLAWLADGSSGRASVLLAHHADRLTREGVNAAAMVLDVVEGKDPVTGRVVADPVRFVDCYGLDSERDVEAFRWRFVIAAEIGRGERERMKERNIRTKRRLAEAGRFAGGAVPFGARVVEREEGKFLEQDPGEAAFLEEAAGRLLRGDSLRSVCRWANVEGWRTRRGKEWERSSLLATLRSRTTADLVLSPATRRALLETIGPDRRSPERSGPKRRSPGGRPQKFLLAGGLGVCGSCGSPLTTSRDRKRGGGEEGQTRYRCRNYDSGRSCPGAVSIDAPQVDAYLSGLVAERFAHVRHLEPRLVLKGGEDLDEAERAFSGAQAALLDSPSAEALAAFQEAKERVEALRSQPQRREEILVETGRSIGEEFLARDLPDRAALLSDLLRESVQVLPARSTGPRGRHGVDVEGRLVVTWRGEITPEEALLLDVERGADADD